MPALNHGRSVIIALDVLTYWAFVVGCEWALMHWMSHADYGKWNSAACRKHVAHMTPEDRGANYILGTFL